MMTKIREGIYSIKQRNYFSLWSQISGVGLLRKADLTSIQKKNKRKGRAATDLSIYLFCI